MVVFNNALAGAAGQAGGAGAYTIERSLRFNSNDSSYLSNWFLEGNSRTFTISFWVKRGNLSSAQNLFNVSKEAGLSQTDSPRTEFRFHPSTDVLEFKWNTTGSQWVTLATTAVFRDPSAWYHIIVSVDTTQSTASDRVKIYVNGLQQTLTGTYPGASDELPYGKAYGHTIGNYANNHSDYFNGYIADFYFIDGQALAETDFGEFDNNGVWQPIEYTGSYGTGRSLGTTSPTVFVSGTADGGALSDLNTSANILYKSDSTGGFCRIVPHTPVQGVTNIKFKGGSYSAAGKYVVIVNGKQIGGERSTSSGYAGDVSVDITEQDIKSFEVRSAADGYALANVRFNDTSIGGTPSYGSTAAGTNSFHLDFSDNSSDIALGEDSSGNVANDWAVNNLKASGAAWDQSQTWSSLGTGTPYTSAYDWDKAFNGITTTNSDIAFANSGTTMTWTPSTAITVNDKVVIYAYNQTDTSSYGIRVNGSYLSATGGYGVAITKTAAELSNQLTSIDLITNAGALGGYLGGVEVDGKLLVDSGIVDTSVKNIDSLFDSPTNYDDETNIGGNYATLNPLLTTSTTNIQNGNLEVTSTGQSYAVSSIAPSSGKWYFEITLGSIVTNSFIGLYGTNSLGSSYLGHGINGYGFLSSGWGSATSTVSGTGVAGDIVGVAFDADAKTMEYYLNGTSIGTISGWTYVENWSIGMSANASISTPWVFNFGQRPFTYPPGSTNGPSSNYKALCTQNLDDLTFKPSEYFDIVTYSGTTQSPRTITGLDIDEPDLVWVKNRDSVYAHLWWDSVRGTDKNLRSDTASNFTETSVSGSGHGIISTSATNGFVVKDGSSSGSNVGSSGSDAYVAWAWDAGSSTVTNTAGTIESQVRANPAAGFSIVSWTAETQNPANVGHGLNKQPEFIIAKSRTSTDNWHIFAPILDLGGTISQTLYLNRTDTKTNVSGIWGSWTELTSDTFGITDSSGSGTNNGDMIAYCFTSVPGYSSFSYYTGDGSDGPFVYTGFRPKWLMVKSIASAHGWMVVDAERNTVNYVDEYFYANSAAGENNNVSNLFTFTANGFKVGHSSASNSANDYVYACFAEHPLKTARAF